MKNSEVSYLTNYYRGELGYYYDLFVPREGKKVIVAADGDIPKMKGNPTTMYVSHDGVHHLDTLKDKYESVIVPDTLNSVRDVQSLLEDISKIMTPDGRIFINNYNTIYRPILSLARSLKLIKNRPNGIAQSQTNWLSNNDIINLLELSGFEIVTVSTKMIIPFPIPGTRISRKINKYISPLLPLLCFTSFFIARLRQNKKAKKISVVIPARNEAGTIPTVTDRVPNLGAETELIFVEGNSTDNTWAVIEGLPSTWKHGNIIKAKQKGKGKGDAVRLGMELATGDIVSILDCDLTMPPEDLPKYIKALELGHADFANGCRLVYPMEKKAMQFANLIANKFFGIAFSFLLSQPIKDTLCGTKVLWREDYEKILRNRDYFGDFDPFGDFDLLFGAAKLNLKIKDIPIHYKDRTYGSTNIERWKHGVILLKMMLFAARKIKFL
jgi:Glycosyl transferase family 2/Methyltransferase domain